MKEMITLTMVIAVKNDEHTIVMTADMRVTTSDIHGKIVNQTDDYKKTLIIAEKYILTFAGRLKIVETALDYINDKIHTLKDLENDEGVKILKEAFRVGKKSFEQSFPTIKPDVVFYIGYLSKGKAVLIGLSSDDDFEGIEVDASIKLNSSIVTNEDELINNASIFISQEIQKRQESIHSYKDLTDIYFSAIHRVDDNTIGKTGTSVVLTPLGIQEYNH